MAKKLSKSDIMALKRFESQRRAKPFVTYKKDGRITRHKSLVKAVVVAKGQALLGRRAFVDKDDGKFTRSVKVFNPFGREKRLPKRGRRRRK